MMFLWFLIGFFSTLALLKEMIPNGKIELSKEQIALITMGSWFGLFTLGLAIFYEKEAVKFIEEF